MKLTNSPRNYLINQCIILINNGIIYKYSLNVGCEWSGVLDLHLYL